MKKRVLKTLLVILSMFACMGHMIFYVRVFLDQKCDLGILLGPVITYTCQKLSNIGRVLHQKMRLD